MFDKIKDNIELTLGGLIVLVVILLFASYRYYIVLVYPQWAVVELVLVLLLVGYHYYLKARIGKGLVINPILRILNVVFVLALCILDVCVVFMVMAVGVFSVKALEICGILLNFAIPVVGLYAIYQKNRHTHYGFIGAKDYAIVLRPFSLDETDEIRECYNELKEYHKNKYPKSVLFRIGDPKTVPMFQSGISDVFLSNAQWKREVSYYAKTSRYIYIIVGPTDGLIWEILAHTQHLDKCYFCLLKKEYATSIVKHIPSGHSSSAFFQALTNIPVSADNPVLFNIRNGNISFYWSIYDQMELIGSFETIVYSETNTTHDDLFSADDRSFLFKTYRSFTIVASVFIKNVSHTSFLIGKIGLISVVEVFLKTIFGYGLIVVCPLLALFSIYLFVDELVNGSEWGQYIAMFIGTLIGIGIGFHFIDESKEGIAEMKSTLKKIKE